MKTERLLMILRSMLGRVKDSHGTTQRQYELMNAINIVKDERIEELEKQVVKDRLAKKYKKVV